MKVLMVCLGNICRSPLAHGVLEERVRDGNLGWEVDSCGTSSWHVGEQPDERSIAVAAENGIDISGQRARQFTVADFEVFDHIIAMDSSNFSNIKSLARSENDMEKVSLLLNYSFPSENRQVPDPYYTGGFQYVFDLVAEAIDKFIEEVHGRE